MHVFSNQLAGFLSVLISAALYATLPILGKLLYATGLSPAGTLALRYLFSLIIVSFFLRIIKKQGVFCFSRPVVMQVILMIMGGIFYFYAIKYLNAGIATVVFYSYPALVAVMASVFYKEALRLSQLLRLAVALLGIVMISGLGRFSAQLIDLRGLLLASLASVCYAGYGILGQKTLGQTGPLNITATYTLLGVIILAVVFPHDFLSLLQLDARGVILGLAMALFNTVLAVFFFLYGVGRIGAASASLVSTAEPAFTLIFAFLILGETLTLLQLLGSSLVMISTVFLVTDKGEPKLV